MPELKRFFHSDVFPNIFTSVIQQCVDISQTQQVVVLGQMRHHDAGISQILRRRKIFSKTSDSRWDEATLRKKEMGLPTHVIKSTSPKMRSSPDFAPLQNIDKGTTDPSYWVGIPELPYCCLPILPPKLGHHFITISSFGIINKYLVGVFIKSQ